jgi:hypothetical protein
LLAVTSIPADKHGRENSVKIISIISFKPHLPCFQSRSLLIMRHWACSLWPDMEFGHEIRVVDCFALPELSLEILYAALGWHGIE